MNAARLLLGIATLAALAVLPGWPHRHLDDPSYLGVIGFAVVAALLLRSKGGMDPGSANRRRVGIVLFALPVVYVANLLRWGGSATELGIQLVGLAAWVWLAWRSRRSDAALWLGMALHALWDAAHYGRVGFIPEWYATAYIAVDVGLAGYVLLGLRGSEVAGVPREAFDRN